MGEKSAELILHQFLSKLPEAICFHEKKINKLSAARSDNGIIMLGYPLHYKS